MAISTLIHVVSSCALWGGAGAVCLLLVGALADAILPRMRRRHLLEIHDETWCPGPCRRFLQDALRFLWHWSFVYTGVIDLLLDSYPVKRAATASPARQLTMIDLCAGGGGPSALVANKLAAAIRRGSGAARAPGAGAGRETAAPLSFTLTDLFPNLRAFRTAAAASPLVSYEESPVDATAVPEHLKKHDLRTMFACFHHFQPSLARGMLADAARNNVSIAVFEYTQRTYLACAFYLVAGVLCVFAPIVLLPWVPTHFLFAPVHAFVCMFDGIVSCIRTYTPEELLRMAEAASASANAPTYRWRAGTKRLWWYPVPITYLIGEPAAGQ